MDEIAGVRKFFRKQATSEVWLTDNPNHINMDQLFPRYST